jgi:two-component system, sensor histidine kinase
MSLLYEQAQNHSTANKSDTRAARLSDAAAGKLSVRLTTNFKRAIRPTFDYVGIRSPELTKEHKELVERRRAKDLAVRATSWLLILVVLSICVLSFGEPATTNVMVPLVNLPFTKLVWFVGLLFLAMTGFALWYSTGGHAKNGSLKLVVTYRYLWCAWITVASFWWFSGNWTLLPVFKPPQPGTFVFSQQSFIFMTISGQAIAVALLAPDVLAIFGALVIGVLTPLLFYHTFIFSQLMYTIAIRWNTTQVLAFLALGVFVSIDYTRGVVREIILAIEHSKAQAERKRADRVVSVVSHDLRQPLATIALKLDSILARSKADNGPLTVERRDINQLREQAWSIEFMINGMLDLSRLRAGTWPINIRAVPLPIVMTKVASALQSDADIKNIEIEVRQIPYSVMTDSLALELILRNLMGNAIRYTPETTEKKIGKVIVEAQVVGEVVTLSVSDNGIGIAQERIDDIFKEYVQIGNQERDRNKGLGLGLSIVQEFAKLLKVDVRVKSKIGKGTTFAITLPCAGMIPDEFLAQGTVPLKVPESADYSGMVVLLIDDDEAPREALRDRLVDWGCYVVDGESADAVIDELRHDETVGEPKVILSDYRLKDGQTGIAAIAAIRQEVSRSIPAAIWTAETGAESLQEIQRCGILRLSKPPSSDTLRSFLTSAQTESVV